MKSWDEYFFEIAWKVAQKSKDPSSKVGTVIVRPDNSIASVGYNGFPQFCDESKMSWERPDKYHTVIHSEVNAILYAKEDLKGCKLYCSHMPCNHCLSIILQKGIREIYFQDVSINKRFSRDQKRAIGRLVRSFPGLVFKIIR